MIREKKSPEGRLTGWGILITYIGENRWAYLGAFTLIMGSSRLAVWIPQLVGRFTDQLPQGLTLGQLIRFAFFIIALSAARVSTVWLGRIIINGHGRMLVYQLRNRLLGKWSTLSPSYYHQHSVGDLLSHALSDMDVVRQFASMGISQTVNGLSLLAASLFMMTQMNGRLALAGLAPLIAIPVIVRYFGPKIRKQSVRYQEALGHMSQTVEEVVGGIRAVKAFGNEKVIIGRYEERVEKIVDEKVKLVRLSALFGALVPFQASLGFIVVMTYGGYLTIHQEITRGDFAAFLLYLYLLRLPLEQLGQMLNVFQRAAGSLSRLSELLNAVPEVQDQLEAWKDFKVRGKVEVKGLTFRYPGTERNVLENVSFALEKGKTVGLVGAMGSGKTTLSNLLLRLYNPPPGTVFIDGVDILNIPLETLRRGIASVPQSGFLFSASVLENIGFADGMVDAEKAENAARTAVIYDNIKGFPDGFQTEIGERGVRLSGGQKQRVAIARMIYKDAPIHILDDSLSAVDTKTEKTLLRNLRDRLSGALRLSDRKTTLIISHRLSAVRHADEILVLADGSIAERGNHAELIRSGGIYSRLWLLQAGTEEEEKNKDRSEVVVPPNLGEELDTLKASLGAEPV